MYAYLYHNLLWSEGGILLAILAAIGLLGLIWHRLFIYLAFFAFLFCLYFFRNPMRIIASNQEVLYAPADGTLVDWAFDAADGLEGYSKRISFFLSPLDVHVQRAPVQGAIEEITYKPGKFMPAFLPKSSELNERNDISIRHTNGLIKVRQISGTIARCIVCWKEPRETVKQGDPYGMIKLGSRVEVFLPKNVDITIKKGERVRAGITVIGTWSGN